MAIIKAPPKQPKSGAIQARVEESVKTQLDQYAKFIESTPSYIVTEALKVLFKRDDEFKAWLGQHANGQNSEQNQGEALTKTAKQHEDLSNTIRCAREYSVVTTACPAPCSESFDSTVRSAVWI